MRDLTASELVIYHVLKANPGIFHVTPDGNHIYFLMEVNGEEGLMDIERVTPGVTYNDLNEEELNEVIVSFLEGLSEE